MLEVLIGDTFSLFTSRIFCCLVPKEVIQEAKVKQPVSIAIIVRWDKANRIFGLANYNVYPMKNLTL